jgi:ribosomal subunit interface protein
MNLTISGHHLEVTPALRSYVTNKLDRVMRHFDQVVDVKVLLTVEKQKEKCRRINVDSMRCGRALGFVTQNILHFFEKNVEVLPEKMNRDG